MATRRKYKQRAAVAPAFADAPAAPAPAPPVEPGMAGGGGAGPLQAALEAQRHAEHLQRQHATRAQVGLPEPPLDPQQRQAIDAHIDNMPGLSDHKKRFLKSHPSLLQPPYLQLMQHAYQLAIRANVPDDTLAMDAAVLSGIHRDIEHHRQLSALMSAHAAGPPPEEVAQPHGDIDEDVAALQAEAAQHLAAHQPAQSAPPPQPRPQRRNMPMQAPVSRDYPSVSGHRSQDADERQIAHVSFPHLPAAQAEFEYLQNRNKYRRMVADGSYSSQGGG